MRSERWVGWLLVAPALLVLAFLTLFPIAVSYTHLTLPTKA